MTMKRKIAFEANSHPEDIQALSNGIITYGRAYTIWIAYSISKRGLCLRVMVKNAMIDHYPQTED